MRFLSDYSEMSNLAVLKSLVRDLELTGRELHFSLPLCRFCACCVRGRRPVFSQDSWNLRQQGCKPLTSSEPDGRVCAVVLLAPCVSQIRRWDGADRRLRFSLSESAPLLRGDKLGRPLALRVSQRLLSPLCVGNWQVCFEPRSLVSTLCRRSELFRSGGSRGG